MNTRIPKWNVEDLHSRNTASAFKNTMKTGFAALNKVDFVPDEPEERWNTIRDIILESAEAVVGKKQTLSRKKHWITEDILRKMDLRRQLQRGSEEYYRLHREIGKDCRRAKNTYLNNRCFEIEELERQHHNRDAYKKIREFNRDRGPKLLGSINTKENNIVFERDAIKKRWAEYVEDLYYDTRPTLNPMQEEVENEILYAEVDKAINQLNNNKACGLDAVPSEFLKAMDSSGRKYLTILCNNIYRKGKLPQDS